MATANTDGLEISERARKLYEQTIRHLVETPDNIGKMVIIDVDTGEYGIDETGIEASRRLHLKDPNAALFGIRIGYDVADAIGGAMERTA